MQVLPSLVSLVVFVFPTCAGVLVSVRLLLTRKCIEAVYKDILPRGLKPWVYLSMTLPPWLVDVNIHPTKQEVQLLYEDYIAGSLSSQFRVRIPD